MRRRVMLGLAALVVAGLAAVPPAPGGGKPAVAPIHAGGAAVERATLDVVRAFLRDDAAAAREAMDRLAGHWRDVPVEEAEALGREIYTSNQAFRMTLDRAREYASAGETGPAFDDFVWVQRACRQCHQLARDRDGPGPSAGGR